MKVDYLENIALEDMLKASATGLDAVHDAILDYTNTMNDASEGSSTTPKGNVSQKGENARDDQTRARLEMARGLKVLRQLQVFAQIRLRLAHIYQAHIFMVPGGGTDQSACNQLDSVAQDSKNMLDNPTLRPLEHALQQEVNVMRAAHRGKNMKSGGTEDIVAILLELRTSLNGWNAPRNGELAVLRTRMTDIMKSLTNKLSNLSRSQIDGTSTYCRGPPLTREDTATLSDSKACADQMAHSEDHDKHRRPTQSTHHRWARATGGRFFYQCPPTVSSDGTGGNNQVDMSCVTTSDAICAFPESTTRWGNPDGLEVATGEFTYTLR
ncbi:unnamed protein product [Sphacelaria rigidula]